MHPETEDLIERITQPLEANAELHLAARSYLLERLGEADDDEESLRAGCPRHSGPGILPGAILPKHWRRWFYLAVMTLIVAMAAPFAWKAYETWRIVRTASFIAFPATAETYIPMKIRNLPERDRILLLGDESPYSNSEKWRPLWRLEPENSVFLAQYAKHHASQIKSLSPEILETAARVDPDNALYPLLQATSGWESIITQKTPSPAEKKAGKRKEWVVKNEAALESRLALLHRAGGMSGVRGYEEQLRARQQSVLPQPKDLLAVFQTMQFDSFTSAWFALHSAPKLLAAKASQCARQGDTAGFLSAVADWKSLCFMSARDGKWFLDGLITTSMLSSPLEDFRDAAQQLGLAEDARRFDEFDKWFKQKRADEKSHSRSSDPTSELVTQKGSTFFSMATPVVRSKVRNPPPITTGDLRPGRYAEHALFGRFVGLTAAVIFLLLAGVAALCRDRQSALVRALSPVMTGLIRISDCVWMIGLGVVAPVGWFLTIYFLTPLGAREWSLGFTALIQPCAQFGAAVLLVLAATLLTAGWRLGLRGAMFGLRGKRPWIGWTMVIILFLAIPGIGAIPWWPPTTTMTGMSVALGFLLGPPLLWLGVSLLLNLINRADESLRRATLARLMIPAWMFAAAAFACLIPVFHRSEMYWFQNDRLTGLADPEVKFSRYEMDLAKVMHQELRELIKQHL